MIKVIQGLLAVFVVAPVCSFSCRSVPTSVCIRIPVHYTPENRKIGGDAHFLSRLLPPSCCSPHDPTPYIGADDVYKVGKLHLQWFVGWEGGAQCYQSCVFISFSFPDFLQRRRRGRRKTPHPLPFSHITLLSCSNNSQSSPICLNL